MATRSRIGILRNNVVQSIYCHWDGYVEHHGPILLEHYNAYEKISELMNLGNISSLAPKIAPTGNHSFDEPEDDVVVAYHRDRGEPFLEINLIK